MIKFSYIAPLIIVLSGVFLVVENSPYTIGRLINHFSQCVESLGASAPCYIGYDTAALVFIWIVGVIFSVTVTLRALEKLSLINAKAVLLSNKIIFQFVLVCVTIYCTFAVGWYLVPLYRDATLSPVGVEQSGWPLPFASLSGLDETRNVVVGGSFNVICFLFNAAFIYVILRFILGILRELENYIFSKYTVDTRLKQYWSYLKRTAVMTIALLILSYAFFVLFIMQPVPVNIGEIAPQIIIDDQQ